ncbi:hypothetical protein EAE99_001429 [Botrytis elliptica]|nr:hypothetical protein EAE99_001429 [Botrytis elliptica]
MDPFNLKGGDCGSSGKKKKKKEEKKKKKKKKKKNSLLSKRSKGSISQSRPLSISSSLPGYRTSTDSRAPTNISAYPTLAVITPLHPKRNRTLDQHPNKQKNQQEEKS